MPKKWISRIVLVLLAFQQAAPPAQARMPAEAALLSEIRPASLPVPSISPNHGTVDHIIAGAGPVLFHIQEAHGSYETQKNILAILHRLKEDYGVKLILTEGSAFPLERELLNFYPNDRERTLETAHALAQKSLMAAPELFLLEEPDAESYGIENAEDYARNGKIFREVLRQREKTADFSARMNLQIERLTAPYLSRELRHFLGRLDDFEAGLIPIDEWLRLLQKESRETLGLDLENAYHQLDWPMLVRISTLKKLELAFDRQAFKAEREAFLKTAEKSLEVSLLEELKKHLAEDVLSHHLSDPATSLVFERMAAGLPADFDYAAYPNVNRFIGQLILRSELKAAALMEELERLEDGIARKLANGSKEEQIVELLKSYRLLKRLFAVELTPRDYDRVLKFQEMLRPSKIAEKFLDLNKEGRVRDSDFGQLEEINKLFDLALDFYAGTSRRDEIMFENIEQKLRESGERKAVVITGGFHAGPFQDHFAEEGYTHVLISPKITGSVDRKNYVDAILTYYTQPLEQAKATFKEAPYAATPASRLEELGVDSSAVAARITEEIKRHSASRQKTPARSELRSIDPSKFSRFLEAREKKLIARVIRGAASIVNSPYRLELIPMGEGGGALTEEELNAFFALGRADLEAMEKEIFDEIEQEKKERYRKAWKNLKGHVETFNQPPAESLPPAKMSFYKKALIGTGAALLGAAAAWYAASAVRTEAEASRDEEPPASKPSEKPEAAEENQVRSELRSVPEVKVVESVFDLKGRFWATALELEGARLLIRMNGTTWLAGGGFHQGEISDKYPVYDIFLEEDPRGYLSFIKLELDDGGIVTGADFYIQNSRDPEGNYSSLIEAWIENLKGHRLDRRHPFLKKFPVFTRPGEDQPPPPGAHPVYRPWRSELREHVLEESSSETKEEFIETIDRWTEFTEGIHFFELFRGESFWRRINYETMTRGQSSVFYQGPKAESVGEFIWRDLEMMYEFISDGTPLALKLVSEESGEGKTFYAVTITAPVRSELRVEESGENWMNVSIDERLVAELAKIDHPSISKFRINAETGEPQVRYVTGPRMEEWISRNAGLDDDAFSKQVMEWMLQIAGALTALHERGIEHGDVKPDNVVIDTSNRAVLIDFGDDAFSDMGMLYRFFDLAMMTRQMSLIAGKNIYSVEMNDLMSAVRSASDPVWLKLQESAGMFQAFLLVKDYAKIIELYYAFKWPTDGVENEDIVERSEKFAEEISGVMLEALKDAMARLDLDSLERAEDEDEGPVSGRSELRAVAEQAPRKGAGSGWKEVELFMRQQFDFARTQGYFFFGGQGSAEGKFQPLTREQEIELWRQDTQEAKHILAVSQMLWIKKIIVKKFDPHGPLSQLELMTTAMEELKRRLPKWNPERGRINTYMTRLMYYAMRNAVVEQMKGGQSLFWDEAQRKTLQPRLSAEQQAKIKNLMPYLNDLEQEVLYLSFGLSGESLNPEELRALYRHYFGRDSVRLMIKDLLAKLSALDQEGHSMKPLTEKEKYHPFSLKTFRLVENALVNPFNQGSPRLRDREVLKLRYGLAGGRVHKFNKIAEKFNVSSQMIRNSHEERLQKILSEAEDIWRRLLSDAGLDETRLQDAYHAEILQKLEEGSEYDAAEKPSFTRWAKRLNVPHVPTYLLELIVSHYNVRRPVAALEFAGFPSSPLSKPVIGREASRGNLLLFIEAQGGFTSWEIMAGHFKTPAAVLQEVLDPASLSALQKERRLQRRGVVPLVFTQEKFQEYSALLQSVEGRSAAQKKYRMGLAEAGEVVRSMNELFPEKKITRGYLSDEKVRQLLHDVNFNRRFLNRTGWPRHVLLTVTEDPLWISIRDLAAELAQSPNPVSRRLLEEALQLDREELLEKFGGEPVLSLLNYNAALVHGTALWTIPRDRAPASNPDPEPEVLFLSDEQIERAYAKKNKNGTPSFRLWADRLPLRQPPLLSAAWERAKRFNAAHPEAPLLFRDLEAIGAELTAENILAFTDAMGGMTSWQEIAAFFNQKKEGRKLTGTAVKAVLGGAEGLKRLRAERREAPGKLIPMIYDAPQFEKMKKVIAAVELREGLASATEIYRGLGHGVLNTSFDKIFGVKKTPGQENPEREVIADYNKNHQRLNKQGRPGRFLLNLVSDRTVTRRRQLLAILSLPEFEGSTTLALLRDKLISLKIESEITLQTLGAHINGIDAEQWNMIRTNRALVNRLPAAAPMHADSHAAQRPVLAVLERLGGIATRNDVKEHFPERELTQIGEIMKAIHRILPLKNQYRARKGAVPFMIAYKGLTSREAEVEKMNAVLYQAGSGFRSQVTGLTGKFHERYSSEAGLEPYRFGALPAIYRAVIGRDNILTMDQFERNSREAVFRTITNTVLEEAPENPGERSYYFSVMVPRALNLTGPLHEAEGDEAFRFYLQQVKRREYPLTAGKYFQQALARTAVKAPTDGRFLAALETGSVQRSELRAEADHPQRQDRDVFAAVVLVSRMSDDIVPLSVRTRFGEEAYAGIVRRLTIDLKPRTAAPARGLSPQLRKLIEQEMPEFAALLETAGETPGRIFGDMFRDPEVLANENVNAPPDFRELVPLFILLAQRPELEYTAILPSGKIEAFRAQLKEFSDKYAAALGFNPLRDLENFHFEAAGNAAAVRTLVGPSLSQEGIPTAVIADENVLSRFNVTNNLARVLLKEPTRRGDILFLVASSLDELVKNRLMIYDEESLRRLTAGYAEKLKIEMQTLLRFLQAA